MKVILCIYYDKDSRHAWNPWSFNDHSNKLIGVWVFKAVSTYTSEQLVCRHPSILLTWLVVVQQALPAVLVLTQRWCRRPLQMSNHAGFGHSILLPHHLERKTFYAHSLEEEHTKPIQAHKNCKGIFQFFVLYMRWVIVMNKEQQKGTPVHRHTRVSKVRTKLAVILWLNLSKCYTVDIWRQWCKMNMTHFSW